MKKRFISRIYAIALSAIMCVGALPNTAFANTDDSTGIEISEEHQETEADLILVTEDEGVVGQSPIPETEEQTEIDYFGDTITDDASDSMIEAQEEVIIAEPNQTIETVASGSCGKNATYSISCTGGRYIFTVSGTGDMNNYTGLNHAPWWNSYDIDGVYIADGITSIGAYAFCDCSSLTSISIPSSVTSIGDSAFSDCSSLTSVSIPSSVTSIGGSAFCGCSSLESISIPEGVTDIGFNTFLGCSSLGSISIPSSVTSIKSYAFYNCSNIQAVEYSGSQEDWENISIQSENLILQRAYYTYHHFTPAKREYTGSCGDNVSYNLSGDCFGYKLVISGSGSMTDYWHFDGFSPWFDFPITEICVNNGITSIGNCAFYCLDEVTDIRIPKSISTVGKLAFFNCTSLSDIYYGGSNSDWNNIVWNDGMYSHENALKDVAIHYNSTGDPDKTFISDQPENISAGMNSVVTFSVVAKKANAYQWQYSTNGTKWYNSSASSAKTDTLTIKVSKSNANNMYRCKVTGTDGTVLYSESAGIDLIPGIVITKQPSSVTGKIGQTVTYAVTADNVDTYQWLYSKDGTNWYKSGATGCTTDTLSIKISSTNQNYYYKCKMIGIDGNSKNSGKAGAVIVTEQPKTCTASVGTTASYYVVAQNISTYQWQYSKDNGESWYNSSATGYNTDTISFKATSTNRATIYRCKLTSTNGLTAYTTAAGFAEGMKIVSQPENVSGSIGDRVTFNVNAQNVSTYQWQYSKDGNKWYNSGAVGNSTSSIQITVSTSNVNNVYRCKLTGTDDSVQYTNAVGVQSA